MNARAATERLRSGRDELTTALADQRLEILPETAYCVKDAAKTERET